MITLILSLISAYFLGAALIAVIKGFAGYDSKGVYHGIKYSFYFYLCIMGWWALFCAILYFGFGIS